MKTSPGEPDPGPGILNPLECAAWDSHLAAHLGGSIFHGVAWARVLQATYGHTPVYFCRWDGGRLAGLLAVMEVNRPWGGKSGVSLPFTDLCPPLGGAQVASGLYEAAMEFGRRRGWRYLESRGLDAEWPGATPSMSFYGHIIPLATAARESRFAAPVRRAIRKAKASGLKVEMSQTQEAMSAFYRLHCLTRRRHGLPPQPARFFEHIARHVVSLGQGFVVTAWRARAVVAAAVFLVRGREAVYKFGASDPVSLPLRPNNLVMAEAIERCAELGCARLHLGRTSLGNEGLRRFKLGFGAEEEMIQYAKYDFGKGAFVRDVDRSRGWFNGIFRCLPTPVLRGIGRLLYPHLT